jgi:hypothetical protein
MAEKDVEFAAFARFVTIGGIAVTALFTAPLLWIAIRYPGKPLWSPPMMAWAAVLFVSWIVVLVLKVRKLRRG